jgi:hypothetical protein
MGISKIINFLSCERMLKNKDNGGGVIFLRSLIISSTIFLLVIAFLNIIDTEKKFSFDYEVLSCHIIDKFEWYGAIFAATYIALYTRFSSQWSYLANLYNLIKQTSATDGSNPIIIAEWKAGFIEDAQYLHLSHKENFAPIIKNWLSDKDVKTAYVNNSPQGVGVDAFLKKITIRVNEINEKYKKI